MCGIAGISNLREPKGVRFDTIQRMTGVLHHRGPDEAGIYLDDWVALGHARLSIIDLSSGTQPIHNEDETMWIVYNGEVFNYPELKRDLLQKGHCFYTTSDTEVVLHLYEEHGPNCLDLLNGQFALAIWDAKKKELFLARDRVGILPLHYTVRNDTLTFGSEVKSIFVNGNISRRMDPIAMDQIFTFWTTLTPRTAFEGIYELPPGHYLKASHGKIIVKKYWDIPFYPPAEQLEMPVEQICRQIQELLIEAIRIRLRADVPVGCYLSGGLDSSGVTALVRKNFNGNVRTFGIRFEEKNFDEGKHQNQMVSFLAVDHSEIQATNEEIGAAFPDALWHCEKPLLRTAPVPLFLLSDVVHKSDFKVVLTGEGADEIFGGYDIYRENKVRRFWAKSLDSQKRPELIERLYHDIFNFNNPKLRASLRSFFAKDLAKTDDPFYSHIIRWENTSRTKTFFSGELRQAIGQYSPYEQLKESLPEAYWQLDALSKAQYLEMAVFLSNYLLCSQGDRVAMAHSVEIRVPYLDHNVMDFVGRIPGKWKILGLNEKHILKKCFRGILPEDIIRRTKHPYRAPIKQSLMNKKTANFTQDMLAQKSLKESGLFDRDKVNRLLHKLQMVSNASEVDSMALAGILSSQLVYHQFVEQFPINGIPPVHPNLIVDRRSEVRKQAN
jgi:asparagine synthase (glutamine-hydrolysing)